MAKKLKTTIQVNVSKIDKSEIFEGKKGKYITLLLFEEEDGPDQYGNNGMVVQSISIDRKNAGEQGPILGNFKHMPGRENGPQSHQNGPGSRQSVFEGQDSGYSQEDDDIPF